MDFKFDFMWYVIESEKPSTMSKFLEKSNTQPCI
jgi:hypothetical protein